MGILSMIDASEVTNQTMFARYVQQELGTPPPSNNRARMALTVQVKKVFDEYPNANWNTLVKLVAYAKNRKSRPPTTASVFQDLRYAWSKGYLPELDPASEPATDPNIERRINEALRYETDPLWRRKLVATTGEIRVRIYEAWRQERACLFD